MFRAKKHACIVCGTPVNEQKSVVTLYLDPPGERFETAGSTPFIVYVSPCCGAQACVDAAWEQIKASSVGKVEAG